MPTAKRLNHVHIVVADGERAIRFYTSVFGLTHDYDDQEDGETLHFLHPTDGATLTLNESTRDQPAAGDLRHFGFVVPEDALDETIAAVQEHGGEFLGYAEWDEERRHIYVRDPDGYTVEVRAGD